jgi:hypothetical protein
MLDAAWPWEWSPSAWSALTFLVLVFAVAWRQVREAQRLREEQARPFVIVDFQAWQTIIEMTITNIGSTLARDVQFTFTPPLATTHDDSARGSPMNLSIFKNGIASLPPEQQMKLFFDQFPARIQAKLPLTYEVEVSYTGPAGRRYTEKNVLDLQVYLGTGGRITRYGVHEIHREIKNIADTVKRWTDWHGLKIVTQADIDERNAE